MKKGLFLFIIFTIISSFLYAQEDNGSSLSGELPEDIPATMKETVDYKLAQRYREMAIQAHEDGDYNQSIEFSTKSKEYSDKILSKYSIYKYAFAIKRNAEKKLSLFEGVGGETNEITADLFIASSDYLNTADSIFYTAVNGSDYSNSMKEYQNSLDKSELGYNIISIDLRREYLINQTVLTNGDDKDKEIIALRDEAKELVNNGDYENSLSVSKNAMSILDSLEAPILFEKAQEALANAKKNEYDVSKKEMYDKASNSLSSANETLMGGKYTDSVMHSQDVIDLVNTMSMPTDSTFVPGKGSYPKYYTVRYRRTKTDSLWRIASYDFIYGDGFLWKKIYEANKDIIKDPAIIKDGQILVIPSLKGEKREGTYDPNNDYGNMKDFAKQETALKKNDTVGKPDLRKSSEKKTDATDKKSSSEKTGTADKSDAKKSSEKKTDTADKKSSDTKTTDTKKAEENPAAEKSKPEEEGNIVVEDEKEIEKENSEVENSVIDDQVLENADEN